MRYPGIHHDGSAVYVRDQTPSLGSTIEVCVTRQRIGRRRRDVDPHHLRRRAAVRGRRAGVDDWLNWRCRGGVPGLSRPVRSLRGRQAAATAGLGGCPVADANSTIR